jgi:hypothetical protein
LAGFSRTIIHSALCRDLNEKLPDPNFLKVIRKRGQQMFNEILYPTDFSDAAQKALSYLKRLKDSGVCEVGVPLYLLYVIRLIGMHIWGK